MLRKIRFLTILVLFSVSFFPAGLFAQSKRGGSLLQSGPMVGYVDMMEALIWVQTKGPARVQIKFWREGGAPVLTAPIATAADHYFIAKHVLKDLEFGVAYQYGVVIDGKELSFDYPLSFKTQPFWEWRTEPPTVNFAIGSCFFLNDPEFDRPGDPYGGNYEIFDAIAKQGPDFMLWLGDNLYLREPEFNSPHRMAYRYTNARSFPGIQPMLASMANYAIWDDHDYGPNDSDRGFPFKTESLKLFKAFWANPQFGVEGTPGIFGKFKWADLDFFLLDDRYHRAPDKLLDPDKDYLGAVQLQWLKDSLVSSGAPFKFVVVGNQTLNTLCGHEAYPKYVNEYADFMSWLDRSDVEGVVFLSGDRHFTELLCKQRPGNYPLFEFTSSPLTSGVFQKLGIEENNPIRVPGTKVNDARNFGMIKVEGPRKERTLTLRALDYLGKVRWEKTIHENELKKPE